MTVNEERKVMLNYIKLKRTSQQPDNINHFIQNVQNLSNFTSAGQNFLKLLLQDVKKVTTNFFCLHHKTWPLLKEIINTHSIRKYSLQLEFIFVLTQSTYTFKILIKYY